MTRDESALRDEISLRQASLLDASRELAAGELSAQAFDAISTRERAAIEKAQGELDAQADVADGDPATALSAYQQVLDLDATNVEALTQTGWLDFSAGSSDKNVTLVDVGVKDLREAVKLAPRQAAPRLYYAIVADATPGNEALAKKEFKIFLRLTPSRGQIAVAQPFLVKLGLKS
jgi:tetratricopeptide (TPR) repeat protein